MDNRNAMISLVLYTTSNCEDCNHIRNYLDSINVRYIEVNITDPNNIKSNKFIRNLEVDELPILVFKREGENIVLLECTEENVNLFLKTYEIEEGNRNSSI